MISAKEPRYLRYMMGVGKIDPKAPKDIQREFYDEKYMEASHNNPKELLRTASTDGEKEYVRKEYEKWLFAKKKKLLGYMYVGKNGEIKIRKCATLEQKKSFEEFKKKFLQGD